MSTPVSGSRPAPSARTPQPAPAHRPVASRQDVEAMEQAFAAVRKRQSAQPAVAANRKDALAEKAVLPPRLPAADRWRDDFAQARDLAQREEQGQGPTGFGLPGQAALAAISAPQMPSPPVDPSGFVALMAQLWARENGKGARDVRVQFGASAWPATGARLVRNAAGTLDIELSLGERSGSDDAVLDTLREGFAARGIALGALSAAVDPFA